MFRISIFGFRIYHTLNVHNLNSNNVESVPIPLEVGIYYIYACTRILDPLDP